MTATVLNWQFIIIIDYFFDVAFVVKTALKWSSGRAIAYGRS